MNTSTEHPAPWWYRLAARLFPSRCREIPEAQNPDRIVLRQVALVGRHVYLQQFASAEDPRYMHSHPWRRMIAIGLWGRYDEHRIAGPPNRRAAPYLYTMDAGHVHHVQNVSPGHTSIFIGIGRNDNAEHSKYYYGRPVEHTVVAELLDDVADQIDAGSEGLEAAADECRIWSDRLETAYTQRSHWTDHIKVKVKRI